METPNDRPKNTNEPAANRNGVQAAQAPVVGKTTWEQVDGLVKGDSGRYLADAAKLMATKSKRC